MEFDRQGRRIPRISQLSLLMTKKRRPGRPRKYDVESDKEVTSKPNNISVLLTKRRGPGRPRKYETSESHKEATIKLDKITDVKTKLKLLEKMLTAYKEIEKIEKENQKNIEKFCSLVHSSY